MLAQPLYCHVHYRNCNMVKHTAWNIEANIKTIGTGRHKKTGTFEKPNQNWRNPTKNFVDRNWTITTCVLRDSNPNYQCLKITSCRWRLPLRMHSFNLPLIFPIARCNISAGIPRISSRILLFQFIQRPWSSRVDPILKVAPQGKITNGQIRWFGGQGMSPNLKMTWLPNSSRTATTDCLAVCDVAPSCWNQASWSCGKLFSAGATIDCSISAYRISEVPVFLCHLVFMTCCLAADKSSRILTKL